MKLSLVILSLILFAGCSQGGYESYDECLLKEMQTCSPSNCKREAKKFCGNYEGKQYSKAFRDQLLLNLQEVKRCIDSGVPSWKCEMGEIDLNK